MKKITNPVGWFEIYVSDLERAKKFYEKVFERELYEIPAPDDSDIKMVVFEMDEDAPNASGALVKMEGMEPGGNSTIVYFSSYDCEIEQKRVEVAGGKILKPKFSIGEYGFISLVLDTEENCIGIHSLK